MSSERLVTISLPRQTADLVMELGPSNVIMAGLAALSPAEESEPVDLASLTKVGLLALAKERGYQLDVDMTFTKAEIIEAIEEAQE